MSQFKSILLAFRPKTLTAAVVPCLAATALAKALQLPVDMSVLWFALLASGFIQIGTNLVNDAVDFKKGADTEKRIGPQRITQAGILTAGQVMALGSLCFAIAVLCGVPLVLKGGWVIVAIGVASVLMGYSYTAGPFPLAYLGLGDLFVIIFFGLIAILGMVFLHAGIWPPEAWVLGLQIGFHCTVLIAINNLRDVHGDKLVNKKTLAVRMGIPFARTEIAFLAFAPFVMNVYWFMHGFTWAALLPLLALPLAIKITKNVFSTEPSPAYNKFLGQSAGLHLVFGLLLAIGFLI
jgi:1,4-dihydroxy-2-naphthoate octaprenyltransferase